MRRIAPLVLLLAAPLLATDESEPFVFMFGAPAEIRAMFGNTPPIDHDSFTVCVNNVEAGSVWRLELAWPSSDGVGDERLSALAEANQRKQACGTWLVPKSRRPMGYGTGVNPGYRPTATQFEPVKTFESR